MLDRCDLSDEEIMTARTDHFDHLAFKIDRAFHDDRTTNRLGWPRCQPCEGKLVNLGIISAHSTRFRDRLAQAHVRDIEHKLPGLTDDFVGVTREIILCEVSVAQSNQHHEWKTGYQCPGDNRCDTGTAILRSQADENCHSGYEHWIGVILDFFRRIVL